jgi:hypothetical protein
MLHCSGLQGARIFASMAKTGFVLLHKLQCE